MPWPVPSQMTGDAGNICASMQNPFENVGVGFRIHQPNPGKYSLPFGPLFANAYAGTGQLAGVWDGGEPEEWGACLTVEILGTLRRPCLLIPSETDIIICCDLCQSSLWEYSGARRLEAGLCPRLGSSAPIGWRWPEFSQLSMVVLGLSGNTYFSVECGRIGLSATTDRGDIVPRMRTTTFW